ncbi:hypothetical protein AB0J55_02185 [Amycolatopsis sp. NPDC049688]|uniref:hypothetical protein n=1 Tax=Amycolatopsis sp. NPDC049688 TaxID=3154733 RepID=UPI00341FFADB
MATLVSASARGLILMALSTPDLAGQRISARPFGAERTAAWSLPALGIAGTAVAFLEPDPEVGWDSQPAGRTARAARRRIRVVEPQHRQQFGFVVTVACVPLHRADGTPSLPR